MAYMIARCCAVCNTSATPHALFCVQCGARLTNKSPLQRSHQPIGALLGGRYRLRQLISVGGNGAVYEARHEPLGTIHALKETLATDPESLGQFLAEARLLARLAHPVLVRVTDYFTEPSGSAFLVMDYVPGETLQHKLEQPGIAYTVHEAIGWILQLCAGLEYLHNYRDPATGQPHPIIHRDVKPLNAVLTPEGQLKLIDLGIARIIAPDQATARVARSVTEPFAPIEQYGAGTDVRSDLYALGVTAYVLLTRQLPPSAPERIARPQKLPIRMINSEVPPDIAAAIEQAMMPRPEARYPSIAAFRQVLELGWLARNAELPVPPRPSGTPARDTAGIWGKLQRAFGSPPSSEATGQALIDKGILAEQVVVWKARQGRQASIDLVVVVERRTHGPPRLRLTLRITEHGLRGRETRQQITFEEDDARAFTASLGQLLQLRDRVGAEIHFAVERTALRGIWSGVRGPLELAIRTSGPRGGVKACTISLDRRQVEALAQELRRGMRHSR